MRRLLWAGLAALFAVPTLAAQSRGMVWSVRQSNPEIVVFDAATDTILATLPILDTVPGVSVGTGDCIITADLTLGFASNLNDVVREVWVIDLTTSPPSFATGINPIPISIESLDLAISPDQRYLLVSSGIIGEPPIAVVDIATRTEVGTGSALQGHISVTACADGSVLASSFLEPSLARLALDEAGNLVDTGERLNLPPGSARWSNVTCAPDGRTAVAMKWGGSGTRMASFSVPGLVELDSSNLSGNVSFTLAAAFHPTGTVVYTHDILSVRAHSYDPSTGAIGIVPLFQLPSSGRNTGVGVDSIAVHPNGSRIYVPVGNAVRVLNAQTGALVAELPVARGSGICVVQQAECFLVLGRDTRPGSFDAGGHTWPTQLSGVESSFPVTLNNLPAFEVPLPHAPRGKLRSADGRPGTKTSLRPMPVTELSVQVLMWNPQFFPGNPEQWTRPLRVTLWSDDSLTAVPYGTRDGMQIRMETYRVNGRRYVRFPFSIDGF